MSGEGLNSCACEMNQNAQTANVAKQKTKDTYPSNQSRNRGEETEELSSQQWKKSNKAFFSGRNHLALNPKLKQGSEHMETAGCENRMSDAVWEEGEPPPTRLFAFVRTTARK